MDLDDHNPWDPWEKLSEVTRIRAWTRFPTPTTVVPELGSENPWVLQMAHNLWIFCWDWNPKGDPDAEFDEFSY